MKQGKVRIGIVSQRMVYEEALRWAEHTTTFKPYLVRRGNLQGRPAYVVARILTNGDWCSEFNMANVDREELVGV